VDERQPSPVLSDTRCPRCQEHPYLHWAKQAASVAFDFHSAKVWSVKLRRFCIVCGYTEVGEVEVNRQPVWSEEENGL